MEPQTELAKRIYDARASTYEDSWHPDYSKRLMELIPHKPGDRVLVACCGTGLETFIAAETVGPGGLLVGVDVSPGMLGEALARQKRETELGPRIKFVKHNVTSLDTCEELKDLKGGFDLLICSNAFVLFDKPAEVVRHWKDWLKDGGRMAIDITHETNYLQGILIERVAAEVGIAWPSDRQWIKDKNSFKHILEAEGLQVESIELMEKVQGQPMQSYGVDQVDEQFENLTKSPFSSTVVWPDGSKEKAKELFRKQWEGVAVNGTLHLSDSLYLYIAKKV